jgi:hypothetical protein
MYKLEEKVYNTKVYNKKFIQNKKFQLHNNNKQTQTLIDHFDNSDILDNFSYENYTRLITTHNTVISDDVGSNIAVENDFHISKSLIFGDYHINASSFTMYITSSYTTITISAKQKEIIIYKEFNITEKSVIDFKSEKEGTFQNCKLIFVNHSNYPIEYRNFVIADKLSTSFQMIYIFNNNVYLGYTSAIPYKFYTTENKINSIQFNIDNIHHFKNIDTYLCYNNEANIQNVDLQVYIEIVQLNLKLYKNFIVSCDNNSEFINQLLKINTLLNSEFDRSGEIIIENKTDHLINVVVNETNNFNLNNNSTYILSYDYFKKNIFFHSIIEVSTGDEIEVNLILYNYTNNENHAFWIEDDNHNIINPFEVDSLFLESNTSNKLQMKIQNDDKYKITWFLRSRRKYFLRNSKNNNNFGTFLFNIQINDSNISVNRGEFGLRKTMPTNYPAELAFSMTPSLFSSNSYIIDMEFYTFLYPYKEKLPKSILDIPVRPSIAESLNDASTLICTRTFSSANNILDPFQIQDNDVHVTEHGLYILNNTKITFKNKIPLFDTYDMYQAEITYSDVSIDPVIYNCDFLNDTGDFCQLFFDIPISISNTYITKINIYNSKIVQVRFKIETDTTIKTINLKNKNSNEILYSNTESINKVNLSYLVDNHMYKNITMNLIPEATYTLEIYDINNDIIVNSKIFDVLDNYQYENWLNTLHIFSNLTIENNKVSTSDSIFSFIPLRTKINRDNDMFPESVLINNVIYARTFEKYVFNNKTFIFIEKYSNNSTNHVFVSIQKYIDKTVISIGDSINNTSFYAYFITETFIGQTIVCAISIPQSLAFGTIENSINYFEKTINLSFSSNNIHIEGKVAKIQNNTYQTLFTSENNKFIFEIISISDFLDILQFPADVQSYLQTNLPKQDINGHFSDTGSHRFLGFAQKNKKIIFKKEGNEITNWGLKHEIIQYIFRDGPIEITELLSNTEYEKTDYYYKKSVEIDSNNYVVNFYPESGAVTATYNFLIIKTGDEYTLTKIQHSVDIEGNEFEPDIRSDELENIVIYKYINRTTYTIEISDLPENYEKDDILLYYYNNQYFYNFDNVNVDEIIPYLNFKIYYYPVGTDEELLFGHKYISADSKQLEKIKYYNFPYDDALFNRIYPANINEVLMAQIENAALQISHSNGVFDDLVDSKIDSIETLQDNVFTLGGVSNPNINILFADKADSSQNLFVHTHKISTNIIDFRPTLTELGNEIIPRRIQYITSSNNFLNSDSTISNPLVQPYENRNLVNFKLTAPHFTSTNTIHKASYSISITKHDIIKELGFTEEEYQNIDKEEGAVILNLADEVSLEYEELRKLVQTMRSSGFYIDNQIQILLPHIDFDVSIHNDDYFGEMATFTLHNMSFSTISTTILPEINLLVNVNTDVQDTIPENRNQIIQDIQCLITENVIDVVRTFPGKNYNNDNGIEYSFVFNGVPYDSVQGIGVSIGQYNFRFNSQYSDDGRRNSIGFVTNNDDAIEIETGALAGTSVVNGIPVSHWYSTTNGDYNTPVTINVKDNFGTISLSSLNIHIFDQDNFHFAPYCPAPLPHLTLISLIDTVHIDTDYEPYLNFYKQSIDKQKIFDNKYGVFELIIEDTKGIMNIQHVQILFLQVRLGEMTGDYSEDYTFLKENIAEREYIDFSFYNGYSSIADIPTLFTQYTNGVEAIYISDNRLKIFLEVPLQRYLYDYSVNKIVPYIFINKKTTPILLNNAFSDYHILNVTTDELVYKRFEGSYAYVDDMFVKVDSNEWAWDEANSLILPEGTVNSFYLLIENQGHKDGLFSVLFLLPEFNGSTLDINLNNNIAFTVIKFLPTETSHGNFNINEPGTSEPSLTSSLTNGTLIIEILAGETVAIQYTILQLPEYIPNQTYNQYFKIVDITNFGGTPTVLT